MASEEKAKLKEFANLVICLEHMGCGVVRLRKLWSMCSWIYQCCRSLIRKAYTTSLMEYPRICQVNLRYFEDKDKDVHYVDKRRTIYHLLN